MDFQRFKFSPQDSLAKFPTYFDGNLDEGALKKLRNDARDRLRDLQEQLYAESKQSLLVVLQAMDAAGKDSTITKLTSRLSAQGLPVHSFKKPSKEEMSHDFLWRVHQRVPAQGEITFFNRSHYEDVLVVKVHGWASAEQIQKRYDHINNFESLLADRGTKVVKFMLNVSPEYQLERFRNRLENPEKHWKFNPQDLEERKHWEEYMQAFEIALQQSSGGAAPWYVIPAENRDFRDAMITTVLADTLAEMAPSHPAPDFELNDYPVEDLR